MTRRLLHSVYTLTRCANKNVAKKLTKIIPNDYTNAYRPFIFDSPVLKWLESKQVNAILSILSVLVGFVFFIFTISFLYFHLSIYLDCD